VGDALEYEIDPSGEIAGGESDDHAEEAAERGRADADRERYPRAMDDARPDVAAEGIRAHPVLRAGRGERMRGIDRERAIAADHIGEDRRQHEQRHDDEADRAEDVAPREEAQASPEGVGVGAGAP